MGRVFAEVGLLVNEDLGNGFERARVDDDTGTVAVYDRESTALLRFLN
jgi:RPA family protein